MIKIRAGIILIEHEEILLVRHNVSARKYHPDYDAKPTAVKDYWVFPGGGVLQGETLETCAKRETLEETSIKVEIGPLLFLGESIWPDGERHIINFFFEAKRIEGNVKKPRWTFLDEKYDEPAFLPLSKLDEIILLPDIKTYIKRLSKGEIFRGTYLKNLWESYTDVDTKYGVE